MNLRGSYNWKKAKIVICAAHKKISSSEWLQFVNPFEDIFMSRGIKLDKTNLTLLFEYLVCTYFRVLSYPIITPCPHNIYNFAFLLCSHSQQTLPYTLGAEIFGLSNLWLETRVIIKILTNPCKTIICDGFSWELRNYYFFFEKKIKMADLKKALFPTLPILKIFL